MQTYSVDDIASLDPKDVDTIAERNDQNALEFFYSQKKELTAVLGKEGFKKLCNLFDGSMKKVGKIYNYIKESFHVRQPESIFSIDLNNGEVKTNKNGKRTRYSTSVVSSFTATTWRFWTAECGPVDIVAPPMKSPERTVAKIFEERIKEHQELIDKKMRQISDIDISKQKETTFFESLSLTEESCPTIKQLKQLYSLGCKSSKEDDATKNAFDAIKKDDLIPKDIFRLSVLVKFPEQINAIINHFQKNFPSFMKFDKRDDNQYEKTLSQNPRLYFDRKKAAYITMENGEKFYIEIQFKQRNQFYAHMRSHKAYEFYRQALADYEKSHSLSDKKRCNDAQKLCLTIHKNAVHQSNLYLLNEIAWGDDNDRTYILPFTSNGQFLTSREMIMKNYLIDDYDTPFDGTTAFATNNHEHLNKCCYLKLIGILPENFDETEQYAKVRINKAWQTLTPMDIENFNKITATAIRYQEIIREKQLNEKKRDLALRSQPTPQLTKKTNNGR